jgi:DNA-binding phage protein
MLGHELTDDDIKISPWNILERLDSEGKIKGFLAAAIEDEPSDLPFLSRCFVKAAQARAINQLVKETGADRQALCDMFLELPDNAVATISRSAVERLAQSFGIPMPMAVG